MIGIRKSECGRGKFEVGVRNAGRGNWKAEGGMRRGKFEVGVRNAEGGNSKSEGGMRKWEKKDAGKFRRWKAEGIGHRVKNPG